MDILKFEQLYRRCFDENDNLTFCGRQACKDLLTFLGDDKYGDRQLNRNLGIKRQQLWATRLVFMAEGALAYLNGREFSVSCPF